jgi:F-type H+-transporting ATPase subunit b
MEYHALVIHFWQTGTFWVAVAVFIFFAAISGKAWSLATGILDKRAETIRTALDEAAILKAEAEAMLADARQRQAQAIEDAAKIIDLANAEAARMADELAKDARAVARRRERMALDRVAAAEKAALADVRNVAIDVATTAVAEMLRTGYAADTEPAQIDRAIAAIPAALRQAV